MSWSVKKILDCIENNRVYGFGNYIYIREAHAPCMKGKWQAVLKGVQQGILSTESYGSDCFIVRKK